MRPTCLLLALSLLSASCGSTPAVRHATARRPHRAQLRDSSQVEFEVEADAVRAQTARLREGGVVETMFGTEVADPFRALEDDTEATRAWIGLQNERTTGALAPAMSDERQARIESFLRIGAISKISVGGERVFFMKREGEMNQPALFVAEPGAAPRKLVDPNTLAAGAFGRKLSLDWYYPSPRGNYVAFGLSQNGDERSTLYVIDVRNGQIADERIEHTKWSRLAWLNAETGFFYTRYPRDGERGYDRASEDTYHRRLFFHRLGEHDRNDTLIFDVEAPTHSPAPSVSSDDRHLVINYFRGWSESDVYVVDLPATRAPGTLPPSRPAVRGRQCLSNGEIHHGALLLTTNCDAPRWKIVKATDLQRPDDASRWRTIVAEGAHAIEEAVVTRTRIVVHRIAGFASELALYDLAGNDLGRVTTAEHSFVEIAATTASDALGIMSTGYLMPSKLERLDVSHGDRATLDEARANIDLSAYAVTQATVPSQDGTPVNLYMVHKRTATQDGTHPVLLTAYGGFNVALLPTFTRHALYWIERGGIFAVANLRGGSELGEAWHRAGSLENKHHVFEDFAAVLRWLSTSYWTRPNRIAITGGSNGGLLMGAMITQHPQLFGAAASYVGLYDMIRYTHFPPAELWTSEYGDPTEAAAFRNLLSYSPYHRVEEGTRYPAVLIETADHDTRVHWAHSTKFAARLQEATEGHRPILFYREENVGHGAGTSTTDQARRYARMYTFIEQNLDMNAADGVATSAPDAGVLDAPPPADAAQMHN